MADAAIRLYSPAPPPQQPPIPFAHKKTRNGEPFRVFLRLRRA